MIIVSRQSNDDIYKKKHQNWLFNLQLKKFIHGISWKARVVQR